MRPSTKKRKEHPPNRTLLDFFSSPDAVKRARTRTSQQPAPNGRQASPRAASREIAVLDSDSDDDAHGKGNGSKSAQLGSGTRVSENLRFLNSATSTPAHLEDRDTFGVPSELLRPLTLHAEASNSQFHTHQHSPIVPNQDQSEVMFGVLAPLLEQTAVRNQTTERCQNFVANQDVSMSTMARRNSGDGTAVEFPVGEWAVGDDEHVSLEILENSPVIDEVEGAPSYEERHCPMCGTDLTQATILEAQTHVNQCLDASLQSENSVKQECPLNLVLIERRVSSDNDDPSTFVKGQGSDLYTVLIDSHKQNEIWLEADATADHNFGQAQGKRRRAPFYKILQGLPIAVDAFCYGTIPGVTAYFLTHAHSDHYTSLGSKWKSGPIYCSEETANLIIHMLAVDPTWIHPLPMDTPTIIPNTGGVSVTLIEANHCPGSCLFFFEGRQTVGAGDSVFKSPHVGSSRTFRYLHCGDFRASPRHVFHSAVKGKYIDLIYLDTTYLNPRYTFSPQPLVISACAELARRLVVGVVGDSPDAHTNRNFTLDAWMKSLASAEVGRQQATRERILVIVGTYSVGKERLVKGGVVDPVIELVLIGDCTQAIAQALGAKIYCDLRKTAILRCQADKELHALLTADPVEANVHILPLGTITSDNLRSYLQRFKGTFSRVIGFRPTGWTYSPPAGNNLNASIQSIISRGQSQRFSYMDLRPSPKSSYDIRIFGVPYSEHSSFFELTCFAMSCDWGRMIPTVNVGTATSRATMSKWLKRWEMEKRCSKSSAVQPRTADYW